MKQTLRREFTNIVFLVLIVAAAVVIYLLSRTQSDASAQEHAQTASPQDAQATAQLTAGEGTTPTETTERTVTPRGVPEAVFATHLATNGIYSAEQDNRNQHTYEIAYGEDDVVKACLKYQLEDGCVSSLELTIPLPYQPDSKSKASIDAYLKEAAEKLTRELSDAVLVIMSDLLPAADAKDELQTSYVRYWVEQTMLLKKAGDDFEDTQGGYRYLAYRSQGEVFSELICVLYLS